MFYVSSAPVAAVGPPNALTQVQVKEFALKARWEVRHGDYRARRSRCLDGRYKPGAGVIAMPGADAGLLAIAMVATQLTPSYGGARLSIEELNSVVFEAVGGKHNFSYHTDRVSFAGDQTRFDGCSHCRLLATRPKLFEAYALTARRVAMLRETLTALEGEHVKPDILRGGHDEGAVLVARNVRDLHSCEPLGPDELRRTARLWVLDNYAVLKHVGRRRAFVYQRDLVECRTDDLAAGLTCALSLDSEAAENMRRVLRRIAEAHFYSTIRHLAPRLPFYNVFIEARTGDVGEIERLA
jgi:hypothetical protein